MNDLGTWQERILANKPKPTNADKIRAMTDDELATFIIVGCQGRECPSYSLLSRTEEEAAEHCWRCWLDWLKQEASE